MISYDKYFNEPIKVTPMKIGKKVKFQHLKS